MVLALLLPVTLGLACLKRDWSLCSSVDQCKPGYTCTADWRCVLEADGGADGLVTVDSYDTPDSAGDGPPAGTGGSGGGATGSDAVGSPGPDLPDAAMSPPGIDAAGAASSGGGALDAATDLPVALPDASLPLPVGAGCSAGSDCASGNCADGVCCDKLCSGCNSCKQTLTGKPDGTCAPVISGQDPHNTCADETASKPCGNDGTCDGAGNCRKVSNSRVCTSALCSGSTFTPAATCDGFGSCPVARTQDCTPFQCGLTGCLKTCASQLDCDSTASYCDTATNTCAAKLSNGKPASSGYQCSSGIVADGVCCNQACTAGCSACTLALNGLSAPSTDGQCLPVKPGKLDPHNTCTASSSRPCGYDGTCDGAGGCHYPASGTSCGASSCAGSTLSTQTCDSTHACASNNEPCKNSLVCASASACKTACVADADCITGDYCASGTCTSKLVKGASCTAGSQCASAFCVDGVCCDGACAGQCQGCAEVNKVGTCSTVSGAPRGTRAACTATAATCAGHCGGLPNQCSYPAGETVCSVASCSSDLALQTASVCNGAGACTASSVVPCGSGKYCSGAACVAQIVNGGSCLNSNQCTSANCSNNLCCAAGLTGCGTSCVSLLSSNTNCGNCGRTCAAGSTCSGGSCYLVDGQSCTAGAQCLSGVCSTLYVDSDGDGYGTSASVQQCGTTVPTGYANKSGDCCDSDRNANPGQTGWFDKADLCGSFDYNCDTYETPKSNGPSLDSCGTPNCQVDSTSGECVDVGGCTCAGGCVTYSTAACGQPYLYQAKGCGYQSGSGGSTCVAFGAGNIAGTQACN